jgi:hypothetical protein
MIFSPVWARILIRSSAHGGAEEARYPSRIPV